MTDQHANENDRLREIAAEWRKDATELCNLTMSERRAFRHCAGQLEAAIAALAAPEGWVPVGDRLPESLKPVLICVEVAPSGTRHVLRAQYAAPNTLELGDDQDWWPGCTTDEDEETTYCPAGWYERNQYDETSWHVADAVIAWQPLPSAAGVPTR